MVQLLPAVIYLLATVSLSHAQDKVAGRPDRPDRAGPGRQPWNSERSSSTDIPGFKTTPPDDPIPGFQTIPLPKPASPTTNLPGFQTIPTPATYSTSVKELRSANGILKDRTSTSVVDPLGTDSNMAPTISTTGGNMNNAVEADPEASTNRTLVITLSTVLSVVAFLLFFGTIFVCYRVKRGRLPSVFARGISPIDDEEIESWKANRGTEKYTSMQQERHTSAGSVKTVKKPPSVIVYQNPAQARASAEHSPRSFHAHNHTHSHATKRSIDIPQTPVLAKAPNSRPGLTDETVEGDAAFIPSPRRHHSRLSKLPPASPRHYRSRSTRSSISASSFRDAWPGASSSSPRASNEYSHYYPRTSHSYDRKHARIYSDSSNPPRLSFEDEFFMGGLSPRPLVRRSDFTPESEIGRAIG